MWHPIQKKPEFAIFASGSEVNIAIEAYQELSRLKEKLAFTQCLVWIISIPKIMTSEKA